MVGPSIVLRVGGDCTSVTRVRAIVQRLLDSTPRRYLLGLGSIVVICVEELPKRERRRLAEDRRGNILGRYHPATKGQVAWIELFADRMLYTPGTAWRRLPLLRDLFVGRVLFHEIGHHVHRAIEPTPIPSELAAEQWRRRLMKQAFGHRLGAARPLIWLALKITRAIRKLLARVRRQ